MTIAIDGVTVGTVNEYAPSLGWQAQWTSGTLASGVHTVTLTHTGGGIVDIDALIVGGESSATATWTPTPTNTPTSTATNTPTVTKTPALQACFGIIFGVVRSGGIGIPNVAINLKDDLSNIIQTTVSDGNGIYTFNGLTPANYSVVISAPAGYVAVGPTIQSGSIIQSGGACSNVQVDFELEQFTPTPTRTSTLVTGGSATYDDTDARIQYSGRWHPLVTIGPYKGTLHYSTEVGNSAQFSRGQICGCCIRQALTRAW
ncbi:MAG: carboxypeptidase regulatory-like domain-containing protein [Chloroflexi bacterium]|nr:carboxypeptidase regulatory-like domain-containing protein [Chloroflexota bacterium]